MAPRDSPPAAPARRDLNGNGVMDPYEDPGLVPEERTVDLLGRLSLEEKVGLTFQTVERTSRAPGSRCSPPCVRRE